MKTTANKYRFTHLGSISSGTLRPQDLLPAFLSVLRDVRPAEYAQSLMLPFGLIPAHAQEDDDADWWQSEECSNRMEELTELLEASAPTGLYLGTHPSDGADFGFWVSESFAADFDGFKSSKDQDYPDDDYQGEWLHVNDHGNVTLYVRENGEDFEVWSCV